MSAILSKQCFEVSWEVCNMVGGIHTVVSSKVPHMQKQYAGSYFVVGPDLGFQNNPQKEFRPEKWDDEVFKILGTLPFSCRMGRWLVPGEPQCLLVDFQPLMAEKDKILARYWELYRLDSLEGGPDYFEPLLFGHAVGMVIERLYCSYLESDRPNTLVHFHEWLVASTILYLQDRVPEIATAFTTHATVLGRALAGANPKIDLPTLLPQIRPETAARDHHVTAKHSLETLGAALTDCFTTVSGTTAEECEFLLGRRPTIITQNGLGENVPDSKLSEAGAVAKARERLFQIAEAVTKSRYDREKTLVVVSSGRYEFINKGFDLYLHALSELRSRVREMPGQRLLAFAMYPAGTRGVRQAVYEPGAAPGISTHELWERRNDPVEALTQHLHLRNDPQDAVHFVFIPIYLNGSDAFVRESYWELLPGADLAVFPSWYEPWGYTPHEAVALGVPAISSDLAGFGLWAKNYGSMADSGVALVHRRGKSFDEAKAELLDLLTDFARQSPAQRALLRQKALTTGRHSHWHDLATNYFEGHAMAFAAMEKRLSSSVHDRLKSCSLWHESNISKEQVAHVRPIQVMPTLRPPFDRIYTYAKENLWWAWNPQMSQLFAHLHADLWIESRHDPRRFLEALEPSYYEKALASPEFCKALEMIVKQYEEEVSPETIDPQVAYFCMEYGLAEHLPLYAGGLGILAGDHLKSASDMRLPLVAVGLAYSHGYFQQAIDAQGRQENRYQRNEFSTWPMTAVFDENLRHLSIKIPLPGRDLHLQVWKMRVGSVPLYLLDSDVYDNSAEDRTITHSLYGGDEKQRILQEWVLATGGVELLKRLKISPKVFHINEGHSSFLILWRVAQLMEKGLTFEESLQWVRETTVFTTHTAVPAGHDHFPRPLAAPFLDIFCARVQKPLQQIYDLGTLLDRSPDTNGKQFSTTSLAISGSRFINGVSQIHRRVTQAMFHDAFRDYAAFEVPVEAITNGVHAPTWIAVEWQRQFSESLGAAWPERLTETQFWQGMNAVPPESVWDCHQLCKDRLLKALQALLLKKIRDEVEGSSMHLMYSTALACLERRPMIITHARRAAPYKRADLLLSEKTRLREMLKAWSDKGWPVLVLYAGKAHPRDQLGQNVVQRVIQEAASSELEGHVLYLENYEIELARLLVSGSDVWLNTPLRPLEASGTSGMKAAMNGCLNLSIADGWWAEGYNGENGWVIGKSAFAGSPAAQNEYDHQVLMELLAHEVVPLYFERDARGIPQAWIRKMKSSIASILPQFNTERMLSDYKRHFYAPALSLAERIEANGFADLKAAMAKKQQLRVNWKSVEFRDVEVDGLRGREVGFGEPFTVSLRLHHPGIAASDLQVQAVLELDGSVSLFNLKVLATDGDGSRWRAEITPKTLGQYQMKLRVLSNLKIGAMAVDNLPELIRWL